MRGGRKFTVVLATLVACCSLTFAGVNSASAADRVALVIGNGAYQHTITLANPPHDARAMADLLRALNFQVIEGEDLDEAALVAKLREFSDAAETANATFVFYAGHGMQVDGKNYVIPIDAKLEDRSALDSEVVPVDRIVKYAKRDNGVAVILFDACRDNPLSRRFVRSFIRSRSASAPQGLAAPAVVGGGVIFGFATTPGEEASDGAGDHSPFTAALLKELPKPGVGIQMALTLVSGDVQKATQGEQVPWQRSNLQTIFYLNGAPAQAPATVDFAGKGWANIENTTDAAVLEAFIQTFGNTVYGKMAQAKLAELKKKKIAMVEPKPVPVVPNRPPDWLRPGPLPDRQLGSDSAPVTIIHYGSLTAPVDAQVENETFPKLKRRYIDTGKVRYIYREFPLDRLAAAGTMLARCAGNDKFFPLVQALYRTQHKWVVRKPVGPLRAIVRRFGFSKKSFDACLNNQRLLDDIQAERNIAAKQFGVNSVPTFIINGKVVRGTKSIGELETLITPYLAQR